MYYQNNDNAVTIIVIINVARWSEPFVSQTAMNYLCSFISAFRMA